MSEVDPDPHVPADEQGQSTLGGAAVPDAGDPTEGGKRGQIGSGPEPVPSIASDEPDDGGPSLPPGGGSIGEQDDAPPVADPGPGA